MRRVLPLSLVAVVGLIASARSASAETRDDLCVAPKEMKTNKWQPRSEVGGMTLLIPPGFGAQGIGSGVEQSGAHYYRSGEHRGLIIGFGAGLQSVMRNPMVSEKGECETQIAGRRVNITVYNWEVQDAPMSASGQAGSHYAAVARFYPSGDQREVFVALLSNVLSDVKSFKQLFWTVSFDGGPAVAGAAPAASSTVATVASNASPAVTAAAAPTCTASAPLPPNAPAASAVIDSAVVQTLLASAAPIPAGFEIMQLKFDASGELAGMAVSQSDLPEASQRELAAVVGTNLKPHDSKEPSSIYLRIDAANSGLHYSVVSPSTCTQ